MSILRWRAPRERVSRESSPGPVETSGDPASRAPNCGALTGPQKDRCSSNHSHARKSRFAAPRETFGWQSFRSWAARSAGTSVVCVGSIGVHCERIKFQYTTFPEPPNRSSGRLVVGSPINQFLAADNVSGRQRRASRGRKLVCRSLRRPCAYAASRGKTLRPEILELEVTDELCPGLFA